MSNNCCSTPTDPVGTWKRWFGMKTPGNESDRAQQARRKTIWSWNSKPLLPKTNIQGASKHREPLHLSWTDTILPVVEQPLARFVIPSKGHWEMHEMLSFRECLIFRNPETSRGFCLLKMRAWTFKMTRFLWRLLHTQNTSRRGTPTRGVTSMSLIQTRT